VAGFATHFVPGLDYVLVGVGTFQYVAQNGNEIQMILVKYANGQVVRPSDQLAEDTFFFVIDLAFPGTHASCWQLALDTIKWVQDHPGTAPGGGGAQVPLGGGNGVPGANNPTTPTTPTNPNTLCINGHVVNGQCIPNVTINLGTAT
jgi:hypothetical protein